ncbi:MAG: helix-turn-helix transcriptional regulator [Pseudonocardiales bacterium]|nr:helix-turn-helix transcriptional regulator [Pseudonocardiales bacterium]MBV9031609.1 helix-turn-helix transcriptional regulator [Pseudonocardiales bacterium]MBW0009427.1 helix-turn-helix transcriptional regulator [Pseudonocardiales bacterium]
MRSIGRRVAEMRTWRGMTLRAVAELAGITESYLSRIECGERIVGRPWAAWGLAHPTTTAPSIRAAPATRRYHADDTPDTAAARCDLDPQRQDMITVWVRPAVAPEMSPQRATEHARTSDNTSTITGCAVELVQVTA